WLPREWRQQSLVLALLTLAVGATVLGAGVVVNTPPPEPPGFGSADHLVQLPADGLAATVDSLRGRFGAVDVIEQQPLVTGTTGGAELRAQDPAGPYGKPMLALVSG